MIAISLCGIGYGIFRYVVADTQQSKTEDIVAEYTQELPMEVTSLENDKPDETLVDLTGLQTENPDVVGYVTIPDTAVSYPVMQSEDGSYYLHHDFSGERSVYGCIYVDPSCYEGGQALLLHGHNMKNGSMFGGLKRYLNEDYRKAHETIYYQTEDEIDTYHVCAIFTGMTTDLELMSSLVPYTDVEFQTLKKKITESGTVTEDFARDDRLLLLSTCHGTSTKQRLIVVAKCVQSEAISGNQKNTAEAEDQSIPTDATIKE